MSFHRSMACLAAVLSLALGPSVEGRERVPEGEATWWSFLPLGEPEVPALTSEIGVLARTPVDAFVLHKLAGQGLRFSEEADRRTWIRRLTFNLTGLPPAMDVVDAFVGDERPSSHERWVDRLLASPRYGERWARHWLDVVHYGETHGYDKDKPRPNAYPYRDYVIRAFNEDRPYARFVREQLAGDVLWPETTDGVVATGFLAAGPWDFIGHAEVPEEKIDGKVARHLDRDDMVATTLNSFCSLTVQCAQCHDHKRDPVTMKDYYGLQAVFAALDRADRDYDPDPEVARQRVALQEASQGLEQALQALDRNMREAAPEAVKRLDREIERLQRKRERTEGSDGKPRSPHFGYHSQVAGRQDAEKWVQIELKREVSLDQVVLFGADEYGFPDFGFPHRFRVECASSEDFQDATLLADYQRDYPRPGAGPAIVGGADVRARFVRITATKLWNRRQKGAQETKDWIFALGEMVAVSGGERVPVRQVTSLDSIEAAPRWSQANLVDGVAGRHPLQERAPEGLQAWLEDEIGEGAAQLVAFSAEREQLMEQHMPLLRREQRRLRMDRKRIEQALAKLPEPQRVYAGTVHTGSGTFKGRGHLGGEPRPIFVLDRGDVTRPGAPVLPGTVPGLVPGQAASFDLPDEHAESDRRIALAEWITHPDNPLTWRSFVNRLWHYHFGQGIVDTPNDFGRIGSTPTHPELLDWLARAFRESGGSVKTMHRLILTSAVYGQGSGHREAAAAQDADNRLLWRQQRRRLEAEAVRDTVLALAGKLSLEMYGPSFMDFVIEKPEHSPHYQYHLADPDDLRTHRRSVYRFLVRSQPQPFMATMDCADPSELVAKRSETNTALQALAMLNNRLMVRMAEHFAERVATEEDPVTAAFALALSRRPQVEEASALRAYASEHGLGALCRLLFNLNEFTFID